MTDETLRIREILAGKAPADTPLTVNGWVRTRRDSRAGISFVQLSDGSSFHPLQVVAPNTLANYQDDVLKLTAGCAIAATGTIVPSPAKGQPFEMQASEIRVIGWVDDPDTYPIQPKPHTLEFLREVAHLRPRTNVIAAATRVRHTLAQAIHRFFDENGFYWIHTPIVTSSDAEGAGAMFRVSTLDLANLPVPPAERSKRDGSDPKDPVVILSVGRRVAKKGYDDLLAALARLPKDLNWRFEHIGAGVLGDSFEQTAEKLGIANRCIWHGARPQAEVFAAYQRADIFVLASKTADDGDREGMPNVLQEAGYQRMAIVSTRSAAIGEFITDQDNGLLADPGAPEQLAVALERLARDPEMRARFGNRANEIVRTRFSYEAGVDWIARSLAQPANSNLAPQIETPEVRAAE